MTWLATGSIALTFILMAVMIWSWGVQAARVAAEQEAAEQRLQKELDAYRRATR